MNWKLFTGFTFAFVLLTMISMAVEGAGGFLATALTADLAEDATTATVSDTTGWASSGYLFIEGEEIQYTAVPDSTTFTLVADHEAHDSGSIVMSRPADALNAMAAFQIAEVNSAAGVIKLPFHLGGAIARAVPAMLTWDYSFLDNDFGTVVRPILLSLSAGFTFMLGLAFVSAIRGLLLP